MVKRKQAKSSKYKRMPKAEDNSIIVLSSDLIDPYIYYDSEKVLALSTPSKHFIPSAEQDYTNLPKTHRYVNFQDFNKKYRKNAELTPEEPLPYEETERLVQEAQNLFEHSMFTLPKETYEGKVGAAKPNKLSMNIVRSVRGSRYCNLLLDYARAYHREIYIASKLHVVKTRDCMLKDPITSSVAIKDKALITKLFFQGKNPASIYKALDSRIPIDLVKRILLLHSKSKWPNWESDIA